MEDDNEVVSVVAIDKGTGYITTSTSCNRVDAPRYAKYYRSIGYRARILTFDELDAVLAKEARDRFGWR